MDIHEIKTLIETHIDNSIAIVETNDNVHFEVIVISDTFKDIKSRVSRQRLVYSALGNKITNGEIHALQLKIHTKSSWEQSSKSKE